jgi:ankyrin repeat protein
VTISAAQPEEDRLLRACAEAGLVDPADLALLGGADIDGQGDAGETPLHLAAGKGWADMARFLLKKGASKNATDNDGDTPLHLAARGGHDGVVKIFIQHGCDINQPNAQTGATPLMYAASDKALSALSLLLDANADADAQDQDSETALMKAAKANQPGAVEALVRGFADLYMKDSRGCTAFDLAKESNAGAACAALYPHLEANDREKTYDMAQKLRATNKFRVGRPLTFKKPGHA